MSNYRRRLMLANQNNDNLFLYGNSNQNGTPNPNNPVNISSLENPIINIDDKEYLRINRTMIFGGNLITPLTNIVNNKGFKYDPSLGSGIITVTGKGDASLQNSTSVCYLIPNFNDFLIDGETYTISLNLEKTCSLSLLVQMRNKETGERSYVSADRYRGRVKEFTVDKSTYVYDQLYLQIAPQDTEQNIIAYPELILGKYTPFNMHGIGSYRDKIYTKDGKVYFEQMTAVFENDNSKDKFGTASSPRLYYYFEKSKDIIPSSITQTLQKNNPGLCNYFKYDPQLSENNTIFILTQNVIRAAFFTDDIEDVETWVADKTITVIYPIVKQEPIEITGYLAKKILEIDTSKNITIYSNNGIYGDIEIIEEE